MVVVVRVVMVLVGWTPIFSSIYPFIPSLPPFHPSIPCKLLISHREGSVGDPGVAVRRTYRTMGEEESAWKSGRSQELG